MFVYSLDIAISKRSHQSIESNLRSLQEGLQAVEEYDYFFMLSLRLAILSEIPEVKHFNIGHQFQKSRAHEIDSNQSKRFSFQT